MTNVTIYLDGREFLFSRAEYSVEEDALIVYKEGTRTEDQEGDEVGRFNRWDGVREMVCPV